MARLKTFTFDQDSSWTIHLQPKGDAMAGGHEGVYEDGVLTTCGICGREVHMLDPEEMDRICDPCATEGWSGMLPAIDLRRGHVVSIGHKSYTVISTDRVTGFVELELYDGQDFYLRFYPKLRKIYVHEHGRSEMAAEIVKARWVMPEDHQVL